VRFGRDETGRWKTTPDRHEDIGRMNISRPLIWAFRVALVLLWLSRAPAPSRSWSGSSPPPGHPRCWHWPRGPARQLASGVLPRATTRNAWVITTPGREHLYRRARRVAPRRLRKRTLPHGIIAAGLKSLDPYYVNQGHGARFSSIRSRSALCTKVRRLMSAAYPQAGCLSAAQWLLPTTSQSVGWRTGLSLSSADIRN
jgi:hypothetical protein